MIKIPKRKWRYPMAYERQYSKELVALVNRLYEATEESMQDITDFIDKNRMDAVGDILDTIVNKIKQNYYILVTRDFLKRKIQQMIDAVNNFNMNEFRQSLKSAIGVDVFQSEPKLEEMTELWVKENITLITSVENQYFDRLENIISDAVRNGTLTPEVTKQIQDLTGVSKRRAQLIAVDQIGKLNGQLTKYRQTMAGIQEYIWRTAGDNRVRPAHMLRNGKKFKWSNPPPDGHPGMAIRCRCVAIPVIDLDNLKIQGVRI